MGAFHVTKLPQWRGASAVVFDIRGLADDRTLLVYIMKKAFLTFQYFWILLVGISLA